MPPKSILIVKTSAIGDVIHTFPVLEYLRRKFPDAKIDWVVEKGMLSFLKSHPDLSEVIPIDSKAWRKSLLSRPTIDAFRAFYGELRKNRYDILFDLQGNTKSALVTLLAKAEVKVGFGRKSVREKTNLLVTHVRRDVEEGANVRQKYLDLVRGYFNDDLLFPSKGTSLNLSPQEQERLEQIFTHDLFQKRPCLMVTFGSKWTNKQLPLSLLQPFLQKVVERFPFSLMLIYGNEQEKQVADSLVQNLADRATLVGDLSLALWQALMHRAQGVIAVDSAALHLCGTTNTPSFSVFGPTQSTVYKPMEERHAAFQGVCPYGISFPKLCPELRTCSTGACIKEINVEALFAAFASWVEANFVSESESLSEIRRVRFSDAGRNSDRDLDSDTKIL